MLYGQEFELRGDRSSDPEPDAIKQPIWTLVGRVSPRPRPANAGGEHARL
ncbi:MAG TPA: hypothetical protein VFS21_22120 [Roseiflexaceae bacterium]|nr:hypothetical protein [Roseiflexaceae bacterium]